MCSRQFAPPDSVVTGKYNKQKKKQELYLFFIATSGIVGVSWMKPTVPAPESRMARSHSTTVTRIIHSSSYYVESHLSQQPILDMMMDPSPVTPSHRILSSMNRYHGLSPRAAPAARHGDDPVLLTGTRTPPPGGPHTCSPTEMFLPLKCYYNIQLYQCFLIVVRNNNILIVQ